MYLCVSVCVWQQLKEKWHEIECEQGHMEESGGSKGKGKEWSNNLFKDD